jgi:hypothetical protein
VEILSSTARSSQHDGHSDETFVEQKIEFGSPALGSEPFEVLKLYKPADLQVSTLICYAYYCVYVLNTD